MTKLQKKRKADAIFSQQSHLATDYQFCKVCGKLKQMNRFNRCHTSNNGKQKVCKKCQK